MKSLARVFPKLVDRKLPFTRDQAVLLMVAINLIILGIDIFLAHSISGSIVPYEWIPIIFGPLAGTLLLIAGAVSLKKRKVAVWISSTIFVLSIIVGGLGSYFHLRRALLLDTPLIEMVRFKVIVWAPPILGPITFVGLGIFGFFASLIEDPVDSGSFVLWGGSKLQLPISKTNLYLFLIGLGIMAMVLSGVMDHSRTGFTNPWLWLPTVVGVFAVTVTIVMGTIEEPCKTDLLTMLITMGLMILVGLIGLVLHIQRDLTSNLEIIQERFLRGAPFMAPLNYANMGLIALLLLLDPKEGREE